MFGFWKKLVFHNIIGNESDDTNMQLGAFMCVSIANVVGLIVDYTMCKKGELVSPKVFKINWHL